jgi:Tat protein secretion system quality control protein TatD with DNase activity
MQCLHDQKTDLQASLNDIPNGAACILTMRHNMKHTATYHLQQLVGKAWLKQHGSSLRLYLEEILELLCNVPISVFTTAPVLQHEKGIMHCFTGRVSQFTRLILQDG